MTKNVSRVMIQLYDEHITKQQIIETITSYKSIKRYAFIYHDKDDAKPHYHLLLDFGRSYDTTRIPSWFPDHPGLDHPRMIEAVKSWTGSVQYLLHKNDPDKYQYPVSDIVANYDLTDDLVASRDTLYPVWFGDLDEVSYYKHLVWINQNVPNTRDAVKMFDLITKRNKLYQLAKEDSDRIMKVIFIYGEPGAGKTTYAKWYAKFGLDRSYYVTGSSNDPLEGYTGQDVLIFDDLRDSTFAFDDLLKILDNHTGSLIRSRYVNKNFTGSHIFITTTKKLSTWYGSMAQQERLKQLYRRIQDYVILEDGMGYFYRKVDLKTGEPVEDLAFEQSPFDPSRLFDQLKQSETMLTDDIEHDQVMAKLKEAMK
jgi:hypothetical protein